MVQSVMHNAPPLGDTPDHVFHSPGQDEGGSGGQTGADSRGTGGVSNPRAGFGKPLERPLHAAPTSALGRN